MVNIPLWKMMDFVSWDYFSIPNWMEKYSKCSKPPTRTYTWHPPSTWKMGSVIYLSYPHDCWGWPWNYDRSTPWATALFNSPAPLGSRCNGSPSHWKGFSAQGETGIGREGSRNGSAAIFSVILNKQHEWINCMSVPEPAKIHKKIWTYRVRTRIV